MRKFLIPTILTILVACTGAPPSGPAPVAETVVVSGGFTAEINALRRSSGVGPLAPNARLQQAAQAHADDMVRRGYFSHRAPNGSRANARMAQAGYSACGWAENIGEGLGSPSGAFAAWRGSSGHLRNMVGANYTEYGLGNAGGKWVLVLARPC